MMAAAIRSVPIIGLKPLLRRIEAPSATKTPTSEIRRFNWNSR